VSANTVQTKLVELAAHNPLLRPLWHAYRSQRLVARSRFDNVFHCCTQKTASQWFRNVFNDPIFTDHTGLETVAYIALGLRYAHLEGAFPRGSVVVHLYVDYPTYLAVPKPDSYRTFFMLRDPRDIVVSWYFHARNAHAKPRNATDWEGPMDDMREMLGRLSQQDGMRYMIDQVAGFGTFEAQRSWLDAAKDPHVKLLRYEDLAADNRVFLKDLLDYLEVPIPEPALDRLDAHTSFQHLAGGRKQGEERKSEHYRKGVAGDWRNHFDDGVQRHFREVTGDLVEVLGYET
jgi:hypothetical protein